MLASDKSIPGVARAYVVPYAGLDLLCRVLICSVRKVAGFMDDVTMHTVK